MPANNAQFDFRQLMKVVRGMGESGKQALAAARPVLGEILVTAVDYEFQTEGRGRWPDLADSTKLKRR